MPGCDTISITGPGEKWKLNYKRYVEVPWQINFIVRALTGMGSIFLVNQWMDYRNIPVSVGLNVLSFFVSGCLGIPGVAMLYGIMFYQFM